MKNIAVFTFLALGLPFQVEAWIEIIHCQHVRETPTGKVRNELKVFESGRMDYAFHARSCGPLGVYCPGHHATDYYFNSGKVEREFDDGVPTSIFQNEEVLIFSFRGLIIFTDQVNGLSMIYSKDDCQISELY